MCLAKEKMACWTNQLLIRIILSIELAQNIGQKLGKTNKSPTTSLKGK
jgi:hypothetical protein